MTDTPVADEAPQPDRRFAFVLLFASLVCVGLGQSLLFTVLPPLGRAMGLWNGRSDASSPSRAPCGS